MGARELKTSSLVRRSRTTDFSFSERNSTAISNGQHSHVLLRKSAISPARFESAPSAGRKVEKICTMSIRMSLSRELLKMRLMTSPEPTVFSR